MPKKVRKTLSHQQLGMRVYSKLVMIIQDTDCDIHHYVVVAKVREKLAVGKQRMQRLYMERFNLKKLSEVQGKEQHCVEISIKFTNFEKLRC
jgi:hypothetical protein